MLNIADYLGLKPEVCEAIVDDVLNDFARSVVFHYSDENEATVEILTDVVFCDIYKKKYDSVTKHEFALICFGRFQQAMNDNDKVFFEMLGHAIKRLGKQKQQV